MKAVCFCLLAVVLTANLVSAKPDPVGKNGLIEYVEVVSNSYDCVDGIKAPGLLGQGQEPVELGLPLVFEVGISPDFFSWVEKVTLSVNGLSSDWKGLFESRREGDWDLTFFFGWNGHSRNQPLSGRYRLVFSAYGQDPSQALDQVEYLVNLDRSAPVPYLDQVDGQPVSRTSVNELREFFYCFEDEIFEYDEPSWLWVDWSDGLTPDDSVQAHLQVQLWAKEVGLPNQPDNWRPVGEIPSSCNPHFVLWTHGFGRSVDIWVVVTAKDRWGNGALDQAAAVQACQEGRFYKFRVKLVTDLH